MMNFKLKTADQAWGYEYPVCEILECKEKGERLSMTETRMVDFCMKHYEQYIMGEI